MRYILLILLFTTTVFGASKIDNIAIDGNTISSENTNGNIILNPNGTGQVRFNDLTATTVPYLDANKDFVSSSITPTELGYLTGLTENLTTTLGAKLDDFTSTTDNAVLRTDGTSGNAVQDSGVLIDDTDAVSGITQLSVDNLRLDGNTLSSTDANGNIIISPQGSGDVRFTGLTSNRAAIISTSNVLTTSSVTDTELGYLSGVTSAVQTQINDHLADTTTHGTTGAIVGTSDTQDLSNKTFTDYITLQEQGSTPSTPPSGDKIIYANTDGKLYTVDDAGIETEVGSGAGGGTINFIDNDDAESASTTGYGTYDDGAVTKPVDGAGGTPTGVTFTTQGATTLSGSYYFRLTSTGALGEGVRYDFDIDDTYKSRVLEVEFDYAINSGTFTAGNATTNSSITVWIYDTDNSQLIELSNYKLYSNTVTSPSARFNGSFQVPSNSNSFRLIFHVADSNVFSMNIDNITVKPATYAYGTPITDWQSYTPTGSWVTNVTHTGRWRRVGDSMEIETKSTLSGAPTAATYSINLPSGYTIDSSKNLGSSQAMYATAAIFDDSAGVIYQGSVYATGTSVALRSIITSGTYGTHVDANATTPITFAANDTVTIKASFPISGWSSSVQMSDNADTRVVAANITGPTSGSLATGAWTDIVYATKNNDTHSAFNTSTGVFTAPVSGFYNVSASIEIIGTGVAGLIEGIRILKNSGSISANASRQENTSSNSAYSTSVTVYLNASDTLKAQAYTDRTSATYTSSVLNPTFSVHRISGPSAIAASELIEAKYSANQGQTISNSTTDIIDFEDIANDTHSAVTTGASWKFTAPAAGYYQVNAYIEFASVAYAAGNRIALQVYTNGSTAETIARNTIRTSGTFIESLSGSTVLKLNAGDYIDLRVANNRTAGSTALTSSNQSVVSIFRLK